MEQLITRWCEYIESKLLPLMGSTPEGNIYCKHKSTLKSDELVPKQINISTFFSTHTPNEVLEIGFNGGFSTLLIKMANPQTNITCVDINDHQYVIPCYNQISSDFNNVDMIPKSSMAALPELIHKGNKYDFIHIDGDHRLEGARKDFEACLKVSHKGTIILFDDTNIDYLNALCDDYIKKGIVSEYEFDGKVTCKSYKHRFFIIN